MKMYVKAEHPTMYNRFGVTYPLDGEPIDWTEFPVVGWESLFGWENQPPVAILEIRNDDEKADIESRLPFGLSLGDHWTDDNGESFSNPGRILCEFDQSIKTAAQKED